MASRTRRTLPDLVDRPVLLDGELVTHRHKPVKLHADKAYDLPDRRKGRRVQRQTRQNTAG